CGAADLVEHGDAGDPRGRERIGDVGCGVLVEVDDVDLLAAQLVHHRTHARAHRADAGALGVDAGHRGAHRHLRAMLGPPGEARDLDRAAGDLGDLEVEEAAHQVRVRAGQGDLGCLGPAPRLGDVGAQTAAVRVVLVGADLVWGRHGL